MFLFYCSILFYVTEIKLVYNLILFLSLKTIINRLNKRKEYLIKKLWNTTGLENMPHQNYTPNSIMHPGYTKRKALINRYQVEHNIVMYDGRMFVWCRRTSTSDAERRLKLLSFNMQIHLAAHLFIGHGQIHILY